MLTRHLIVPAICLVQGPAEIPDDFAKTVVSGTVDVGILFLSALLARLQAFQLP